jgi:hypothetical protein
MIRGYEPIAHAICYGNPFGKGVPAGVGGLRVMTTVAPLSGAVIESCRPVPRKARDAGREWLAEVFTANHHARRLIGRLGFTAADTFWAYDARPTLAVATPSAFRL